MIDVQLTQQELALICEALDSHAYWQLSDERYRRDGYVLEPGSDDSGNVEKLEEARALLRRLEPARRNTPSAESP